MSYLGFGHLAGRSTIQKASSYWVKYGFNLIGRFNAVDDGIPTVSFLGFFTYFVGQEFWVTPFYEGITPQFILVNGIRLSAGCNFFLI